ncbi:hypothetical protein [Neisseria sp. 74A18]|uniref:hypothetical protein n=1 Tax=Neisseria sp. 74A18 TaxID=1696094 RepID=UPI0006CAD26A|nr:hypothetical protein [Neisseria sp. 74A18]KPN74271.1 hypothetical protein AKG43_03435 [Neisseria sp. 74A18]
MSKKIIINFLQYVIPICIICCCCIVVWRKIAIPESVNTMLVGAYVGSGLPWLSFHTKKWLTSEESSWGQDLLLIFWLGVCFGIPAFFITFSENLNQLLGANVIRIPPNLFFSYLVTAWLVKSGIEAGDSK